MSVGLILDSSCLLAYLTTDDPLLGKGGDRWPAPDVLSDRRGTISRMIGRLHGIVIDCPDPSALASFYEEVFGMIRVQDDGDWVVIGDAPDRPGLAFTRAEGFTAPTWPQPEVQQQMHFDVFVDDLDAAEAAVLKLGARRLPGGGEIFRVFADPAGHPFCLCKP